MDSNDTRDDDQSSDAAHAAGYAPVASIIAGGTESVASAAPRAASASHSTAGSAERGRGTERRTGRPHSESPILSSRNAGAATSHQARLRQQAHALVSVPRAAPSSSNNRPTAPSSGAASSRSSVLSNSNSLSRPAAAASVASVAPAANVQPAVPPEAPPSGNNIIRMRFDEYNRPSLAAADRPTSVSAAAAAAPEQGVAEDADSSTGNNGWSVVHTGGGTPPSARSLHAAALLNGIMYVFGGYDGFRRVNTFHAFSFADKRWSPVLPSSNSANPPSPRDRHIAVAYGNSFYVHGGFDGTSRVSDFWGFDFSSMTWREVVALLGRPPSPRHSHAAVVHRQSLYIFGGYDGSYKSDLHEFDFSLSQWNPVPAAGRRPRARYRTTAVVHKNTMILYGGHDGTRHLSDTHLFDFETRTWTALVTEGTPPTPRDSHVSVVNANSMYIFGGSSGSAMNDLHELQLPSTASSTLAPAKWRPVKTSGTGQPSHRFCHVGVAFNESMFVFGGYDGSERLNDFIRFDFAVYDLSFEVPPSTILSEYRSMVDDPTLSDVTFIVEGTPIYAHKLMLMRCSYFRALFLGDMKESREATIRIEQVSHPIFLQVLEYLYTDQLRIPFESAMELFEAADLFCIPRLKTMCEKRILQSIAIDNAAAIFHAADMHCAQALRQKTKKYILSHFEEVTKTSGFEDMGRSNIDLVFELLQSR